MFEDLDEIFGDLFRDVNKFKEIKKGMISDSDLGEPTERIIFDENGYIFEKKIWNLKDKTIVRVEMVSTPVDVYVNPTKRKIGFLEKRLEKAIENENYELASKVRDELNTINKK
jgi:hypothetical protein